MKRDVLFICVHNSARSQMAEALLNELCPNDFSAESAGLEPGKLSLLAIESMREIGIDIASSETKEVFDLFKAARRYSYVITVCDETSAERCPIFPGQARRLHWSFPDPNAAVGGWEARLAQTRVIRDEIRARLVAWCSEECDASTRTNG